MIQENLPMPCLLSSSTSSFVFQTNTENKTFKNQFESTLVEKVKSFERGFKYQEALTYLKIHDYNTCLYFTDDETITTDFFEADSIDQISDAQYQDKLNLPKAQVSKYVARFSLRGKVTRNFLAGDALFFKETLPSFICLLSQDQKSNPLLLFKLQGMQIDNLPQNLKP